MMQSFQFPSGKVQYWFQSSIQQFPEIISNAPCVLLTDSHLYELYPSFFSSYPTIVIAAGESTKSMETLSVIMQQLINFEVDKTYYFIGVGGGVVTDIAGLVASTYMRGIRLGLMPTSLLAMVDAAIGGKNGVNVDVYKNMVGTIRQPEFILFDHQFLNTLPDEEWSNGFAEIIKYACLFDEVMLMTLDKNDINYYKQQEADLQQLIQQCVLLKNKVVLEDEREQQQRKLLNFGHTVGHAIENNYSLSHGKAVAIGMVVASKLSVMLEQLPSTFIHTLEKILQQYQLPITYAFDPEVISRTLKMDKKRQQETIDFILLKAIGKARIRKVSIELLTQNLITIASTEKS
ncbi:MAG TPA: 3-dehydroquinate synthase [Flavipsychrobacter sp.]|mgnify:CR=1 FL=1|nr:3-dehydroquinate synthase [Flavipsychrobacter sp.]